jgi:hypothetical protein
VIFCPIRNEMWCFALYKECDNAKQRIAIYGKFRSICHHMNDERKRDLASKYTVELVHYTFDDDIMV